MSPADLVFPTLLNPCLIVASVEADTPPAPRCSLSGLPCPALAMAGPS